MPRMTTYEACRLTVGILLLTLGCGVRLKETQSVERSLTQLTSVYVAPYEVTADPADTPFPTTVSTIFVNPSVAGREARARAVMEQITAELKAAGFTLIEQPQQADAVVYVSVGMLDFDPQGGWVATRAAVRFADPAGGTIAEFEARAQAVTPSASELIIRLAAQIRNARPR